MAAAHEYRRGGPSGGVEYSVSDAPLDESPAAVVASTGVSHMKALFSRFLDTLELNCHKLSMELLRDGSVKKGKSSSSGMSPTSGSLSSSAEPKHPALTLIDSSFFADFADILSSEALNQGTNQEIVNLLLCLCDYPHSIGGMDKQYLRKQLVGSEMTSHILYLKSYAVAKADDSSASASYNGRQWMLPSLLQSGRLLDLIVARLITWLLSNECRTDGLSQLTVTHLLDCCRLNLIPGGTGLKHSIQNGVGLKPSDESNPYIYSIDCIKGGGQSSLAEVEDQLSLQALNEWNHVLGALSGTEHNSKVQSMFKEYLEGTLTEWGPRLSDVASVIFLGMRHLRVDSKNQLRWLKLLVHWLKITSGNPDKSMGIKKISSSLLIENVLISQLESMLCLFSQMSFVDFDDATDSVLPLLNDCYKLLKKIAQDTTGHSSDGASLTSAGTFTKDELKQRIKSMSYRCLTVFFCICPKSIFDGKFPKFFQDRVLNHLDEPNKADNCLDMLILALTHLGRVRSDRYRGGSGARRSAAALESEAIVHSRMKNIWNVLVESKKVVKLLYSSKFSEKYIFSLYLVFQQDMDFAMSSMLPLCFDVKRASPLMMTIGLDCLSLLIDSPETRENESVIAMAHDLLQTAMWHCESMIGVEKIGRRSSPLIMTGSPLKSVEIGLVLSGASRNNGSSLLDKHDWAKNVDSRAIQFMRRDRGVAQIVRAEDSGSSMTSGKSPGSGDVIGGSSSTRDEFLSNLEAMSQRELIREGALMSDPGYLTYSDRQLLIKSYLEGDAVVNSGSSIRKSSMRHARECLEVLSVRQKQQNIQDLAELIKKTRSVGAKNKEYLGVFKACLRCCMHLRPEGIILDNKAGNKLYIGNLLLHPSNEIAQLALQTLIDVVKSEKLLLSKVLLSLSQFICQFYIHESFCLSVLLQAMSKLVDVFNNDKYPQILSSVTKEEFVGVKFAVADLCQVLNRCDSICLAFLCHTNVYVRYGCLQLLSSVRNVMKEFVGYFWSDKSDAVQQYQLTFPQCLGHLLELYSSDLVKRARLKFRLHQDNMKLTVLPFAKHYIDGVYGEFASSDRSAVSRSSPEQFDIWRALLSPNEQSPMSALMDAMVELIESLCPQFYSNESEDSVEDDMRGSVYFDVVRLDCCRDMLLSEKWLQVDEQSHDKGVIGSMCIALIPLIGFSDNGLDNIEFYNSLWRQIWGFTLDKNTQLLNTVMYALQSAHPRRILALYKSVRLWYFSEFQDPMTGTAGVGADGLARSAEDDPSSPKGGKLKKKQLREIHYFNCKRLWVYHHVLLALTGKERLHSVFEDELLSLKDEARGRQHASEEEEEFMYNCMISFVSDISERHLIEYCHADFEVFRCVSRCIENVCCGLISASESSETNWMGELWDRPVRERVLLMLQKWSHCSDQRRAGEDGARFIEAVTHSGGLAAAAARDKAGEAAAAKVRKLNILQVEYQAYRAATAVLGIGPALSVYDIIDANLVESEAVRDLLSKSSRFRNRIKVPFLRWSVEGQKEGLPSLHYLMKNHYSLLLQPVLNMLHSELSRGNYGNSRIFFDVLTSLDLPDTPDLKNGGLAASLIAASEADLKDRSVSDADSRADEKARLEELVAQIEPVNVMQIAQALVVFCLSHLLPFVPSALLSDGKTMSLHRRDEESLLTLKGVPLDCSFVPSAVSFGHFTESYVVCHPVRLTDLDLYHSRKIMSDWMPLSSSLHSRIQIVSPSLMTDPRKGVVIQTNEDGHAEQRGQLHSADARLTIRVCDDIMHALSMSRKAFNLLYNLALKLGSTEDSLSELQNIKAGLQSSDLRDVARCCLGASEIFASNIAGDISHEIVDEILSCLEGIAHRMYELDVTGQLTDSSVTEDQLTLVANLLTVSLPWFRNAPLHSCTGNREPEQVLKRLLNLMLKFEHHKRPSIDGLFIKIWHVLVSSNTTVMSNPIPNNVNLSVRFLISTVVGRFHEFKEERSRLQSEENEFLREVEAARLEAQDLEDSARRKGGFGRSRKKKLQRKKDELAETEDRAMENLAQKQLEKDNLLRPEEMSSICENIVRHLYMSPSGMSECVIASLLQFLNAGCGLGGHVLENKDHIQVVFGPAGSVADPSARSPDEDAPGGGAGPPIGGAADGSLRYVDPSFLFGGESYSNLVCEVVLRWYNSLVLSSSTHLSKDSTDSRAALLTAYGMSSCDSEALRASTPIVMVHCLLFVSQPFETLSNPLADFLADMFVSLLPPTPVFSDEIVQIATWMRDRHTYRFIWAPDRSQKLGFTFDPSVVNAGDKADSTTSNGETILNNKAEEPRRTRDVFNRLKMAFDGRIDINEDFLRMYFAGNREHILIEDLTRILFCCYRIRYGDSTSAVFGLRLLQWATVKVDSESTNECVFKSVFCASKALRLFSICIVPPLCNLHTVRLILKAIVGGLKASEQVWMRKEKRLHYGKEDVHMSLVIAGIEALCALVQTKEWTRPIFRVMLFCFWIALNLLQCRVALVQLYARKLLRCVMGHKKWIVYLFGHTKEADGTSSKIRESQSLQMFWKLFKSFSHNFGGIQDRLISSMQHSVGLESPLALDVDVMMVLTCCWLIRCDVLCDRNLSSRLAANLAFFLPYSSTVLHPQYFRRISAGTSAPELLLMASRKKRPRDDFGGEFKDEEDSEEESDEESLGSVSVPLLIQPPTSLLQSGLITDESMLEEILLDESLMHSTHPATAALIKAGASRAEILRQRAAYEKKVRLGNAQVYNLLALYMQQNIVDEGSAASKDALNIAAIDFDNADSLRKYPLPKWSKIDAHFRSTYALIHTVFSHISSTLVSCRTLEESGTKYAIGDFCQALIDLFIPTQAATLARVFGLCVDMANNPRIEELRQHDLIQLIGTLDALCMFVPRLFKQCREMRVYEDVISCFEETFEKCMALTSHWNKEVSQSAHHFVLMLTRNGYKPLETEDRLRRAERLTAGLHPALRAVDRLEDGMSLTISSLSELSEQCASVCEDHSDAKVVFDAALERLLKMEPKMTSSLTSKSGDSAVPLTEAPSAVMSAPLSPRATAMSTLPPTMSFMDVHGSAVEIGGLGSKMMLAAPKSEEIPSVRDKKRRSQMILAQKLDEFDAADKRRRKMDRHEADPYADEEKMGRPSVVGVMEDVHSPVSDGGTVEEKTEVKRRESHRRVITFGHGALRDAQLDAMKAQSPSVRAGSEDASPMVDSGRDAEDDSMAGLEIPPMSSETAQSMAMIGGRMNGGAAAMLGRAGGARSSGRMYGGVMPSRRGLDFSPRMSAAEGALPTGVGYDDGADPDGLATGKVGEDYAVVSEYPPEPADQSSAPTTETFDETPVGTHVAHDPPVGDLTTFLTSKHLLKVLLKYLKKKHKADYTLLEFFLMADQFKEYSLDSKKVSQSTQREHAKVIIESFLLPDSKKFIESLQGMTRHEAMKKFVACKSPPMLLPSTLFDRAKSEVKAELISRVFPGFMHSDRYARLVREGAIIPP